MDGTLEEIDSNWNSNYHNCILCNAYDSYHPDEQGLDLARPRVVGMGSVDWNGEIYDANKIMEYFQTENAAKIAFFGTDMIFTAQNAFYYAYQAKAEKYSG